MTLSPFSTADAVFTAPAHITADVIIDSMKMRTKQNLGTLATYVIGGAVLLGMSVGAPRVDRRKGCESWGWPLVTTEKCVYEKAIKTRVFYDAAGTNALLAVVVLGCAGVAVRVMHREFRKRAARS